jgi:hypothetical protein
MSDEVQKPAITAEDLERMAKLTSEIAEFRKSLAPMTEMVVFALESLSVWEQINTLMNFEGKEQVKFLVKLKDKETEIVKPFEVIFKSKRV